MLIALAICIIAALVAPRFASAGSYQVRACNAAGAQQNSWRAETNHGGITAYSACADGTGNGGMVARHAIQPAGWTVPGFSYAAQVFDAPAGTSIIALDASLQAWQGPGRSDSALGAAHVVTSLPVGQPGSQSSRNTSVVRRNALRTHAGSGTPSRPFAVRYKRHFSPKSWRSSALARRRRR
jgi:hypothetical protein